MVHLYINENYVGNEKRTADSLLQKCNQININYVYTIQPNNAQLTLSSEQCPQSVKRDGIN